MEVLGYSRHQVDDLIKNCPVSCGTMCGLFDKLNSSQQIQEIQSLKNPTNLTGRPSLNPTMSPTNLPTQNCEDDTTYSSHFGLDCSSHGIIRCDMMSFYGYSLSQVTMLVEKCPKTCGICMESSEK